MRTQEIALATEEILWKYRALIKNFQNQGSKLEFYNEDLEKKYRDLEKITQSMQQLLSEIIQPSLLVELNWIWKEKF